ncbi:hypothetical protein BO70DRAFT_360788 [Aspergillus heteromorphus CBS 117.55]|uniref:ArfGap-domain-containing protein n=1 Tax=Aspergillus heteromorphus CBS 117.55 TaxID=1448321 RepID=A0A317WLS4_9EURO|nr:uncharacterized protein BO70DRAFT_360788 [Aspergillus heteromorphus CBS 117.55]PWY85968.1 hypothetical protein BO70DRAFT_360788 [Aspergillus heteromorphus CBS 117.55]
MRCAALHRKLGTHISKVKSLSMDTWTDDQVDNMKSHGNNIMNKIYNSRNVKPPVPSDVDESDACMERFIRQKYQYRSLDENKQKPPSRHDSGYDRSLEGGGSGRGGGPGSPEGSPPPLPPKPARPFGFGLRSASSATNLNRMSNRGSATSPQSDTFGAGISVRKGSGDASLDAKLATLRDMGFANERRNAIALRELSGNLEKTIETLIRLGEGNGTVTLPRAKTPATPSAADAAKSANPFDMLDARPPTQPGNSSFNPFDAPPPEPQAPVQSLEQSFQNLQVAQPLFPHSTGGYPMRQASLPQPLYQQTATPPVPANYAQSAYVSSPQPLDGGHNPFFQTGAQPQASLTAPVAQNNPFFGQVSPQTQMQPPPSQMPAAASASPFGPPRHANTMPIMSSSSPFGQTSPFQTQPQAQPQQQPQPQFQSQPQPQAQFQQQQQPQFQPQPPQPQFQVQFQQPQGSLNPYQSMTAPATPQSAGYPAPPQYGYQATAQRLVSQPTGRNVDKNSILSLYQLSQQTPSIPENPQFQPSAQTQPFNPYAQTQQQPPQQLQQQQPQQQQQQPYQQPTLDPTGTRNPFFTPAPRTTAPLAAPGVGPGVDAGAGAGMPYMSAPQGQAQPQPQPFQQQQQQPAAAPSPFTMNPSPTQNPGMGMNMNMGMGMGMAPKPAAPGGNFPRGHMSQQSVDVNGFQSGRHSPDAFASLSARYG